MAEFGGYTLRRLVWLCGMQSDYSGHIPAFVPLSTGLCCLRRYRRCCTRARSFLNNLSTVQAIVMLNFANAFNSIRRDHILEVVQVLRPAIYNFVYLVHAVTSTLKGATGPFYQLRVQGDPIGPLHYSLTLHHHSAFTMSEFIVLYLHYVTLRRICQDIFHDLVVMRDAVEMAPHLTQRKVRL